MVRHRIPLVTLLILFGIAAAQAQTANATAPTGAPGGPNQAQQFPSGGTVSPDGTASPATGKPQIGPPTALERDEQTKSDKDTRICKGC